MAAGIGAEGCSTQVAEDRAAMTTCLNLTRREGETYTLVMAAKSNKEIAASLGISSRTAKFHVANILKKHGVGGRLELFVKVAGRATLTKPP